MSFLNSYSSIDTGLSLKMLNRKAFTVHKLKIDITPVVIGVFA